MANKNDELVLCFKRDLIDVFYDEKVHGDLSSFVRRLLRAPGLSIFARRGDVETNKELLQPIPYCILHCPTTNRILSYKRSKAGGETRLHNQLSVGFGGHVSPDDAGTYLTLSDASATSILEACCSRELNEELDIANHGSLRLVQGAIYDTNSEVSSVHIGVTYSLEVASEDDVKPKEDAVVELNWINPASISDEELEQYESWSKIVIESLKPQFTASV